MDSLFIWNHAPLLGPLQVVQFWPKVVCCPAVVQASTVLETSMGWEQLQGSEPCAETRVQQLAADGEVGVARSAAHGPCSAFSALCAVVGQSSLSSSVKAAGACAFFTPGRLPEADLKPLLWSQAPGLSACEFAVPFARWMKMRGVLQARACKPASLCKSRRRWETHCRHALPGSFCCLHAALQTLHNVGVEETVQ